MWTRRTLHDCADELEQVSRNFRKAYLDQNPSSQRERDLKLRTTSNDGVELLRILALAVRSDQDSGLLPTSTNVIGTLKSPTSDVEIEHLLNVYRPPYATLPDTVPLQLREGLNKVAHVNGAKTGFFADATVHDLLLSGENRGVPWFAVLSIPDLCAAIKIMPDQTVSST